VKHLTKQWLAGMPWEDVLAVNQSYCQMQEVPHQLKEGVGDSVRQTWENTIPQTLHLVDVLEFFCRCANLIPFAFNNANTFSMVGKKLVDDRLGSLPPLEGQIIRNTIGHFVAGKVRKKELLQVLEHFQGTWKETETTQIGPQAQPSSPPLAAQPATPIVAGTQPSVA